MIRAGQLRAYAALGMPENNTDVSGGVIDLTTGIDFSDLTIIGGLQVVSSNASDATSLHIYGRLGSGMIASEIISVNGQTPAATALVTWERLMKVSKAASSLGDIAVEQVTAAITGLVQSVVSDQVVLATGASSSNDAYVGMVFRITAGTGIHSIAKVIGYDGPSKTATLDQVLSLDTTSVYRIGSGVVLSKLPTEVMSVRRPFYNVAAQVSSGSDRVFYEKIFWKNHSTETLVSAVIQEVANPTGKINFGVDLTTPSISTAANRLTAPVVPGMTFGRLPQAVSPASPNMVSGQTAGVWLSFSVPAGQSPIKSSYISGISGQTV